MSRTGLKRYWPFYISLIITGVVMVLLFLRPDSALGLTVDVSATKKFESFPAGFKLLDPATGQPEEVTFIGNVVLAGGEFTDITKVTLSISQTAGDPGYVNFGGATAVNVPLPTPPNYIEIIGQELTSQLPTSGGQRQGQLFSDVVLNNTQPDAFGYGYGYRGKQGGGVIEVDFGYTPPSIAGKYRAEIKVFFEDTERAAGTTDFVIVPPFTRDQVQARETLYPRSNPAALTRDLILIRVSVDEDVIDDVVSVTVDPGLLNPNRQEMDRITDFHPAILKKWGIDPAQPNEGNLLAAMKIIPQAEPLTGTFSATVRAVDIAGQEVVLSNANGAAPTVEVKDQRDHFIMYLGPGLNFISTPLQCTDGGSCTADFGFDIDAFLAQPAVNAKVGFPTLADVVEIIWYYCAGGTNSCPAGGANPKFVDYVPGRATQQLENIRTGAGYIVKTKPEAFETVLDPDDPQFPTTAVPVPIRVAFAGKAVALPPPFTPPGENVFPVGNLIGLHSERDSTVGNLLNNVDLETERLWIQLFAFINSVDTVLDEDGNQVHDPATGRPVISLVQGVLQSLFERSEPVLAGVSFWLEMCDTVGRNNCTNTIGPVLELR